MSDTNTGLTPLTPDQIALQENQAAHENRLRLIIDEIDVLANVVTGGMPDQTISSRAAIADINGNPIGRGLSKILDIFQKNHGMKADAGDLQRAMAVVNTERKALGLPPIDLLK